MSKLFLVLVLSLPLSVLARSKFSGRFDVCTESIEKNGVRFQLSQVWFVAGENTREAKQLNNFTVDYKNPPFAHNFTFTNLPKEKLWLNCVYFACGDAACSTEKSGSEPEFVYHEIKKMPVRCQSKVKAESATRIEYFVCDYEKK